MLMLSSNVLIQAFLSFSVERWTRARGSDSLGSNSWRCMRTLKLRSPFLRYVGHVDAINRRQLWTIAKRSIERNFTRWFTFPYVSWWLIKFWVIVTCTDSCKLNLHLHLRKFAINLFLFTIFVVVWMSLFAGGNAVSIIFLLLIFEVINFVTRCMYHISDLCSLLLYM